FQLFEAAEHAYFRVKSLARTSRSGNLGTGPASWIDRAGYYLRSTVYRMLLPAAIFRLIQRNHQVGTEPFRWSYPFDGADLSECAFSQHKRARAGTARCLGVFGHTAFYHGSMCLQWTLLRCAAAGAGGCGGVRSHRSGFYT